MKYTIDKIKRFGSFEIAGVDTAIVLLFLSIEYGRSTRMVSVEDVFIAITMSMLIVLRYFFP